MFFRQTHSKKVNKPILQLVENKRTPRGVRQTIVVSLGSQLNIPKNIQTEVARAVEEKLIGQVNLLDYDFDVAEFADKIVQKIQREAKWNSTSKQIESTPEKVREDKTVAEIFVDDVTHSIDRELGPVLIGHHFWNKLGFDTILSNLGFAESQIKNAEISVLNRLIAGDSEHGILSWLDTVALPDILNFNASQFGDDRFYRISDKLHSNKSKIEEGLYQNQKSLYNLTSCIFLYDLTNTYFEGLCLRNTKAQRNGNQKEKRSDCPQIVIALILDSQGFIRRHDVFEGKLTDVKSLDLILKRISNEFEETSSPTIVFDRGMASKENVELIDKYDGLKYIFASRSNEEKQFIEDFQTAHFESIKGRESANKTKVEVLKRKIDDDIYLLCKSDGRKKKETAMRNQAEQRLESDLKRLADEIEKGKKKSQKAIENQIGRIKERHSKAAKYYDVDYIAGCFSYEVQSSIKLPKRLSNSLAILNDKFSKNQISFFTLNKTLNELEQKYDPFKNIVTTKAAPVLKWGPMEEKSAKEKALDGNYLLKTNRDDLEDDQIWNLYTMLTLVEAAFRNLKSNLALRPNYHHKEERVEGHVLISMMAYNLLHAIEFELRQQGVSYNWKTVQRLVSSHSYSTIQLPTTSGAVINLRKSGTPEGVHVKMYNLLGVDYKNLPQKKVRA